LAGDLVTHAAQNVVAFCAGAGLRRQQLPLLHESVDQTLGGRRIPLGDVLGYIFDIKRCLPEHTLSTAGRRPESTSQAPDSTRQPAAAIR
jgi:hypothetical protein